MDKRERTSKCLLPWTIVKISDGFCSSLTMEGHEFNYHLKILRQWQIKGHDIGTNTNEILNV